jgi:hypothetical protein
VSEPPLRAAAGLRTILASQLPSGVVVVRQARKDGRPVAVLRMFRHEHDCSVEAQVFPRGSAEIEAKPGPYRFATLVEATAFLDDAVDALTHLGCEVE